MSGNGRTPQDENEYSHEEPVQARRYRRREDDEKDEAPSPNEQDLVVDDLDSDQPADNYGYDDPPEPGADDEDLPEAPEDDEALSHVRLVGHGRARKDDEDEPGEEPDVSSVVRRVKSRALQKPEPRSPFTAQQRLLILDIWKRSGLPAGDFTPLVGLAKHTLYDWRRRFDKYGPAGLSDRPRGGPTGSRVHEHARRAILMLKEAHPDWGVERIHLTLLRGEGYAVSADAVNRVLKEEGYVSKEEPTRPHDRQPQFFERAKPNQLWQTDLFTFMLKRENRRVHLVAFMDDNSRYIVGYGLHASASSVLVREVFEAAIANYGAPQELLTDNGTQYHTWRGKSDFSKLCEKRGVKQIIARPRHPETLGKIERFWGTLWRELVESTIFQGLDDARKRIGLFIDYYNFQRPHQGIGGLYPADRYFNAAPEVLAALKTRVEKNALELSQQGVPRKTVYITGKVGDVGIALHSEGDKVIFTDEHGKREEVNLAAPGRRAEQGQSNTLPSPVSTEGRPQGHPAEQAPPQSVPGTSPLDALLPHLRKAGGEA